MDKLCTFAWRIFFWSEEDIFLNNEKKGKKNIILRICYRKNKK